MEIIISDNKQMLGEKAAEKGAELIRNAVSRKGKATIILATGTSQFEMLGELVKKDIDWSKVTVFHLDEYIGISANHPASFRRYLRERFADKVHPGDFVCINGEADPEQECLRLGKLISDQTIDVAFVGIGENGHLAFNDPPADFVTKRPYLVVSLDEDCRRQQLGEGWFRTLNEVPEKAISMSVHQIMQAKAIICSVPDKRKAEAVKKTVEGVISPIVPASILRKHKNTWLFLDKNSAMLLSRLNSL